MCQPKVDERSPPFLRRTAPHWVVVAIGAVWLAHMLVYVWMVPPWQHYDEPTHFEYALLIRELGRRPSLDEQLPSLRRAIAASMLETGFYQRPDLALLVPDLASSTLVLGVNERSVPPAYYTLVALATLPFRGQSIETQLYVGRLVSVALGLWLFAAAYALLRLFAGDDWQVVCWTLVVLALQPALADNMSALSSDALANATAAMLLLGGVWFVQRPNALRFFALLAGGVCALAVKRTLIPMVLLIPVALLFVLPIRVRRAVVATTAVCIMAALLVVSVQPWPLAFWSGSAFPGGYVGSGDTPMSLAGRYSFALGRPAGEAARVLRQPVPALTVEQVAGQNVTLAAWMRGDRAGLRATTPILQIDGTVISHSVVLDTSWQLVTLHTSMPATSDAVAVLLAGPRDEGVAFYDSVALMSGDTTTIPRDGVPDRSLLPDVQDSARVPNLLRNSGAEQHMLPLPSALRLLSGRLLDEEGFADALATVSNPAWIAAAYPRQVLLLFASAWGAFGWGEVLVPTGWFGPLGLLVIGSLVGTTLVTIRAVREQQINGAGWRLRAWWLCLAAVGIGWGMALLRVHSQPFPGAMFWSFGRYTFVAIVPSLLVFTAGMRALFPERLRVQGLAGVVGFLLIFAVVAVCTTALQ